MTKLKMVLFLVALAFGALVQAQTIKAADYGIAPGKPFTAADVARMLADVRAANERMGITFEAGVYNISAEQCQERELFISNHDQVNPRKVFLPLEDMDKVTFLFPPETVFNLQGRIIFATIEQSDDVTIIGGTVDYEIPMITQVEFLEVDAKQKTVKFRPIAGTQTEMAGKRLFFKGYDFRNSPGYGILFEANGRIAYRTSDCPFNLGQVTDHGDGTFTAANCAHRAFKPGQHMALRTWDRPAPGIVISQSRNVTLIGTTVHYADGMALLAQNSEDIAVYSIKVIPNREKGRFFTTQADATHFSGCRGKIQMADSRFIGMMDDAINVHGTYLKVLKRVDDKTLECAYMHHQTYGIYWGAPNDKVTFVRSKIMERIEGSDNRIESIEAVDKKVFRITFKEALPASITPDQGALGIENLTQTPTVYFAKNYVANNRARGALFSTPRKVDCMLNTFDHVSGSAIVLCGDCNGWYETGACTDVTISNNVFINALTSPFQFTEAVISICPAIPELNRQTKPFHSNISIMENTFFSFDRPLVYAKSVKGLTIYENIFSPMTCYPAYHHNRQWLTLEKCEDVTADPPFGLEK